MTRILYINLFPILKNVFVTIIVCKNSLSSSFCARALIKTVRFPCLISFLKLFYVAVRCISHKLSLDQRCRPKNVKASTIWSCMKNGEPHHWIELIMINHMGKVSQDIRVISTDGYCTDWLIDWLIDAGRSYSLELTYIMQQINFNLLTPYPQNVIYSKLG